tara:strand:+ start:1297 stop:2133 length:837 start_codon:yes stop_codon:yes gene_type:complete
MSTIIVNSNDFSPNENMIFTKPKANNAGGKSVGILNNMSKKSLLIQTPLMMNWGVNVYENANNTKSYDFSLQFPREEFGNDDTKSLLDMLVSFEEKVKLDAQKNSRDWFGKATMSAEVVEALWSPMLKYPKDQSTGEPDKTRSPTLKVKLPVWDGEYKFELFDVAQNVLIPNEDGRGPEELIQKGSNVACIIQCGGIWFANGKFGVTWKLYQGVVKQIEGLERGKCHIKMSSQEESQLKEEVVEESKETVSNTYDSDGENVNVVEETETKKKTKSKKK